MANGSHQGWKGFLSFPPLWIFHPENKKPQVSQFSSVSPSIDNGLHGSCSKALEMSPGQQQIINKCAAAGSRVQQFDHVHVVYGVFPKALQSRQEFDIVLWLP